MNNTTDVFLSLSIGSSAVVAAISKPKYDADNSIEILGYGTAQSSGVNKGLIINIDDASRSIKEAILKAKEAVHESIGTTVVSISGNYTTGVKGSGAVTIQNGLISESHINQAMQMALSNTTINSDYDLVHVIPISFMVDDIEVDNPIRMNGSRLEVNVYIVTAKRNALINIKSALKVFGIEDISFVLDSYAASLSTLDEQQKKIGAVVINLGSTTTEFVYYKGSSIIYNGFLPVGSKNITSDISITLQTPISFAEKLKIEHGSLIKNYSAFEDGQSRASVSVPRINDEENKEEVALDFIQGIVHARVEETLVLVRNELKRNALLDNIGSGIVLTGGMSEIHGIKELAKRVFEGIPVAISSPKTLPNAFRVSFDEQNKASIVGLIMFGLGINRGYQLDSNKRLLKPIKKEKPIETIKTNYNQDLNLQSERVENTLLEPLQIKKKSGIFTKLMELF